MPGIGDCYNNKGYKNCFFDRGSIFRVRAISVDIEVSSIDTSPSSSVPSGRTINARARAGLARGTPQSRPCRPSCYSSRTSHPHHRPRFAFETDPVRIRLARNQWHKYGDSGCKPAHPNLCVSISNPPHQWTRIDNQTPLNRSLALQTAEAAGSMERSPHSMTASKLRAAARSPTS